MKTTTNLPKADSKKTTSLVKKMLKEKFGIAVSVRTESYTGGSSFNVSYNLGPDNKTIESALSGLQHGNFNGMEDIYEYNSDHSAPVIEGFELDTFGYVFVRQEISEEFKKQLFALAVNVMPEGLEDWKQQQEFSRYFKVKNFVTQNEADITLIKAQFNYDDQDIEFIYSVNGVEYNTKSLKPINAPEPTFNTEVENLAVRVDEKVTGETSVITGIVQVVDYSEKAFAVIGDTKPIKDKLKELGGKFNARLKCGAGWIFSKKHLETVTNALSA